MEEDPMAINLKKILGDGLGGLDKSHGSDTLYELLEAMINQLNDQGVQFNLERLGVSDNVIIDGGIADTPSSASTQLTGASGVTEWRVNLGAVRANVNDVDDAIAAAADTVIHDTDVLVTDGQSCYAYIVVSEAAGSLSFEAVEGTPATTGSQVAPTDAEITTAVGHANWAKCALCLLNRTGDTTVTQSEDNRLRDLVRPSGNSPSAAVVVTAVAVE
jgi:hypothetical protein